MKSRFCLRYPYLLPPSHRPPTIRGGFRLDNTGNTGAGAACSVRMSTARNVFVNGDKDLADDARDDRA